MIATESHKVLRNKFYLFSRLFVRKDTTNKLNKCNALQWVPVNRPHHQTRREEIIHRNLHLNFPFFFFTKLSPQYLTQLRILEIRTHYN